MSEHQIANAIMPGDLVFDIGSNIGGRAEWFLLHGANVVCVEPQPAMIQVLKSKFDNKPNVIIVDKALGNAVGNLPMSICSELPVLSTLSESWKRGRFANLKWDQTIEVEVTTLDLLVAKFGTPRYVKIDVEGFEKQVLAGLLRRIVIVSFEFTSEYINTASDMVEHLIRICYRKFNFSGGEDAHFELPRWTPYYDLIPELRAKCQSRGDYWGDIYAN
jgi:FkbM family methyltransferase